ncbi:MAG: hypothetical protein LBT26_08660 [Clostridiales Family XIII bacterium]|jgi:hypothetical protein|nr:hypothetical protein [Clostridiales Family XIII bacterium]
MNDIVGSALGSVDTAVIIIRDYRKATAEFIANNPGEDQKKIQAALDDAISSGLVPSHDKTFKVQFNPKELTLDAHREINRKADAEAKGTESAETSSQEMPTITLSLELIFDEVNLYDSFMSEKMSPGVATMATNLVSMRAGVKGKTWSVQPVVEGFIGALRNPYTRSVCFQWGKFSFNGQLRFLRANYTMFSTSGRPVRAKISMRIMSTLQSSTMGDLEASLQEVFGGDSSDLSGVGSAFGNVFNMGALGL